MSQAVSIAHYTAAQIAAALRRKRSGIAKMLLDVPPSGQVLVRGVLANAWSLAALPSRLQEQLALEAKRQGYRNAEAMLSSPPKIWNPPIPLKEIAQKHIDEAAKLQRALALSLQRNAEGRMAAGELEELGVADYKREFGHSISMRQWRTLFTRTLQRIQFG